MLRPGLGYMVEGKKECTRTWREACAPFIPGGKHVNNEAG